MNTFVTERDMDPQKGFPDDVSEGNLLPFDGPRILKTAHVTVSSQTNKSDPNVEKSGAEFC